MHDARTPHDDNQHKRPHTPPVSASFLEFDLIAELAQLHREPAWNRGQNARTLVKYDDFCVVLTALKAARILPLLSASCVLLCRRFSIDPPNQRSLGQSDAGRRVGVRVNDVGEYMVQRTGLLRPCHEDVDIGCSGKGWQG